MFKNLSTVLVLFLTSFDVVQAQSPVIHTLNSEWLIKPSIEAYQYFDVYLKSTRFLNRSSSNEQESILNKEIAQAWLHNDPTILEKVLPEELDAHRRLILYEELGFLYQKNEMWHHSIKYFDKAAGHSEGKYEYWMGYNWYQLNNQDSSVYFFEKVISNTENAMYSRACYYLAVILDEQGLYDEAVTHYLEASKDITLLPIVGKRVIGILTDNGKYDESLALIKSWLEITDPITQIDLKATAGEIFFYLEKYESAIQYFSESVPKRSKWPPEIYYKYAYSLELTGDTMKAKNHYEFAGNSPTLIGQLASYRLGNIFVLLGQYSFAASAFESAARLDFDKIVKESSAFHQGKTLLQADRTAEAISSLEDFISRYNTSKYKAEAQSLLAEAFLFSADYSKAINYYSRLSSLTRDQELGYMKASYQQASVYYNSGKTDEASILLSKVEKYKSDPLLFARVSRLMGDIYYQNQEFKKAIEKYVQAKAGFRISDPELGYVLYGLGVSYLSDGQPEKAAEVLATVRPNGIVEKGIGQEAQLRHADAIYSLGDIEKALSMYKADGFTNQPDYRMYQTGICLYLLGRDAESIYELDKLVGQFPNSSWADNALFQSANTEFEKQAFEKALEKYEEFELKFSENTLIPHVLLNKGLCYTNLNKYQEAYSSCIKLISQYTNHDKAADAILALQDLQKRGFTIQDIEQYIEMVRVKNPNAVVLQSIEYDQALSAYFSKEYGKAQKLFSKYLDKGSSKENEIDALFYLGDCMQKQGEWKNSIVYFERIVASKNTTYLGRSLDKLGKAHLIELNFDAALEAYRQLEGTAVNKREKFVANEGQMLAYFSANKYDSALLICDEIVSGEWYPLHADLQANLIKYKSLQKLGRQAQGFDLLLEISNSGQNIYAAEAHYLMAEYLVEFDDIYNAREILINLINSQAAFKEWTEPAYFMLVDIYIKMGEDYQAKAVLQSIIDKAESVELKAKATKKWQEMEEKSLVQKNDTLK